MLLCAHHEHKLSIRSSTHGGDPALKTTLGMETKFVIQGGCCSAATLGPQEDPSRARGHPSPTARCLELPTSAPLLPPSSHRRAKAQLGAAQKSGQGLRVDGGAAAPEPGRSIHRGPTPRRHPSQRHCSRRGRIRARLTWGPQPPQLTGMSPARNDQPHELLSRRATPPAAAPQPSPPPRPAARPRPAHPRLPPQQLQPATPPNPHASHSLSREGRTPLARRTPRQSPRKSGWAFLKRKEGTGKTFPRAPGQLAGPPRASCDHAQLPLHWPESAGPGEL